MTESGDIKVGYQLPVIRKEMSLAKSRLYSLPMESFHTHEKLAKKAGLPFIVPQGMMSYEYLSEMCTLFFGNEWAKGGTLKVKFTGLLRIDDILTCHGVVKEITEVDQKTKEIVLDIWVENQRGEKVAIGTASGFLPP